MSLDKLIENDGVKRKDVDAGYTVEQVPVDKDDNWYMPMKDDSPGFVDRNNYWDRI